MWKFYKRVIGSAFTEVWNATDKTLASVAVALFLVGLFNREAVKRLTTTWDGVSRWWGIVPIGVLVLYRLLRDNYEKFSSLESEVSKLRVKLDQLMWPSNRPQIVFDRWDQIPANHPLATLVDQRVVGAFVQRGFHLVNDGEAAHEVRIEAFEIDDGVWASSAMVTRIEGHGGGFALVWLENQKGIGSSLPHNVKWNLLGAMAKAEETKQGASMYREDYRIPVSVIYRDGNNVWYRSRSTINYIPSQHRLQFGPTTQEPLLGGNPQSIPNP
jgi:hypothetical protein